MGRYFKEIEDSRPTITFVFEKHLPHPVEAHCSTRMQMFGELTKFEPNPKIDHHPFGLPHIAFKLRVPYTSDTSRYRDWSNALGLLVFNMAQYAAERGAKIDQILIEHVHERRKEDE